MAPHPPERAERSQLLDAPKEGAKCPTRPLLGLSGADWNELLHRNGVELNDLPAWQKRGYELYRGAYDKAGHNPLMGAAVQARRRRVERDMKLPMRDAHGDLVTALLRDRGDAGPD